MVKHFNIKVKGKVQGVWYRASAQAEAQRLGLTGFAKNMPDGSVYCEAEGIEGVLQEFVKWCRRGPELAEVETVEVAEDTVQGFTDFGIRR
jgi:acylphosphatase